MRADDDLPTMVTRLTLAVKAQQATAENNDIYASSEAFTAAVLNANVALDKYYVVDLLLAMSSEESISSTPDGQLATQILKVQLVGLLTNEKLDAIQSTIAAQQAAPTFAVSNMAVVRAAPSAPSAEELRDQIEKSVKPVPSQPALRDLINNAIAIKNPSEGLVFFLREMPFAMHA